jgi:hypothetical protein
MNGHSIYNLKSTIWFEIDEWSYYLQIDIIDELECSYFVKSFTIWNEWLDEAFRRPLKSTNLCCKPLHGFL